MRMPSLLDRLRDVPIAVVDVETTGASPRYGDRVTEVGVARYEGGEIVRELARLVDPHRLIPQKIVHLTGISQDMVAGQPVFADRIPEVVDALAGAVVVGHNVRFDLGFLQAEFVRAGTSLDDELGRPQVLDTVRIARRLFGRGGNGLQRLARRLEIQPTAAHRALADAVTTGEVLRKTLGFDATLLDAVKTQGGPMQLVRDDDLPSPEVPDALRLALECRGRVRLTYLDARRKETCRDVEPLEIRGGRGEVTLVAHCLLREDRRFFKMERIVAVEPIALAAGG